MTDLLPAVWAALGGAPAELRRATTTGPAATLPSTFPVTGLGAATVAASLLVATPGTGAPVGVDTRQLAVALRSERYLRRDGRSPGSPFDPLSAFHRTADGWLRLHANYPWHRAAALRVLGCTEQEVPAAIAGRAAAELETALHAAGGVGAAVRTRRQWRAETGGPPPLVTVHELGPAPPRPARRPGVLDLTRVIAGPVTTRTLAAHGADVLRLDAPDRPEIPLQAYDTPLPGRDGRVPAGAAQNGAVAGTRDRPGPLPRAGPRTGRRAHRRLPAGHPRRRRAALARGRAVVRHRGATLGRRVTSPP